MTPEVFVQLHGTKIFPHSEELFLALATDGCALNVSGSERRLLPCSHFLGIYRGRVKHLEKYSTPHASSIRQDCEGLCRELEIAPEEPCRLWSFEFNNQSFGVFEGTTTNRILGCICSIDKRKVDEATWAELWGE